MDKTINKLPDYEGIADNMGDFFSPTDCIDKIMVREGKVKSHESGVVWMLMAALKLNGRLNLLVWSKKLDGGEYELDTSMVNDEWFEDLIKKTYQIK